MSDPKIIAVETTAKEVGKFLPPKARKILYPVAGSIGVIAAAFAPVFPGTVGDVLNIVAAACTALVASVAVSHV